MRPDQDLYKMNIQQLAAELKKDISKDRRIKAIQYYDILYQEYAQPIRDRVAKEGPFGW